jgi:hypothetical protein
MKRRGLQLSRRHRWILYAASLALFISGVAWAGANHLDEAGAAGDSVRDLKTWLLKIHGFSAMAFVLVLGTLLPLHVRRAWHAQKNRKNGFGFLSVVSLLVLSGYALYYLGDEDWRNAAGQFHLWLGLVSPALLVWHIGSGRKATSK